MSNHGLVLKADQDFWTDQQVAALGQLGIANASKGDLQVFFHQSQRTGLDPFARQIYMIQRGGKWGIQASIDGLRIVAQRSGNYGGQTPTQWCGADGVWTDVWLQPTPPAAARVGVYYKDVQNPTWAVAKWDSYAVPQNPIWKKMPDLMLGKCAEALALRKAFPNDLSGIYTSEEMAQADNPTEKKQTVTAVREIEPVAFTAEDVAYAEKIIEKVSAILDIDELRQVWAEESDYLDVPASGATLKEAINKQVEYIKSEKEAK